MFSNEWNFRVFFFLVHAAGFINNGLQDDNCEFSSVVKTLGNLFSPSHTIHMSLNHSYKHSTHVDEYSYTEPNKTTVMPCVTEELRWLSKCLGYSPQRHKHLLNSYVGFGFVWHQITIKYLIAFYPRLFSFFQAVD